MNVNSLFIRTLLDLEKRIKSKDPYEILLIAALLRKLLTDDNPLVNQVNRSFKIEIEFMVNDRPAPVNEQHLEFWSIQDGFDPETSAPHLLKPIFVSKDKLLKLPLMIIKGEIISVLDLINFLSHVQGAVHIGTSKDIKERQLKDLEDTLTVGGLPPGIRSIIAVARVVIKGLVQLRKEVLKKEQIL